MLMGDQVFVGASIGIALSPDDGADPDDLLRKADIALYEAKKNGRGRYQVFAGDMDDILTRRRADRERTARGPRRGGELGSPTSRSMRRTAATIVGAEALVRWEHPMHGALLAGPFHRDRRGARA